jgi:hypothetical protein
MQIAGTTIACTVYCGTLESVLLILKLFTGKRLQPNGFGFSRSGGNKSGPGSGVVSQQNLPGYWHS